MYMYKLFTFLLLFAGTCALAQPAPSREIKITVVNTDKAVLTHATVALLKTDSTLLRTNITDSTGFAAFADLAPGNYIVRVTRVDYNAQHTAVIDLRQEMSFSTTITLQSKPGLLQDVTVTARKPFIQILPDKTIVNVEAGITNTGATALEVLERAPGVTVDRDGGISLKGKPNVQIMIDGKPAQLSGADLQNMLSGMSATQIDVIELMDNPSAKYDAAGNAGIINIKTKKNKQVGFNGSVSAAYGQGIYPRNNNSLQLNYRNGSFNFFLTYSFNFNQGMMDMYALRSYYKNDGSIASLLEQPYFTTSQGKSHSLKTGVDYFVNKKTTVGVAFTGFHLNRRSISEGTAIWMKENHEVDSSIHTAGDNNSKLQQAGINFNARHVFDAKRELTADVDFIKYDIATNQYFENMLMAPGAVAEASKGNIPSTLDIFSAKIDYSQRFGNLLWETGWKTSRVNTDNLAQYYFLQGTWQEDLGKSNHFLYLENIHALYTNFSHNAGKWNIQSGLRYEYTGYRAHQLGNAINKDSAFNRKYGNLFPTVFVTYEADSLNSFTLRAGRRIDRPAFQKLNPFVFIINKYTFQTGNPYFKPQFTWNVELTHTFKQVFSTTLSYNILKDYISQVFYADTATDRVVYTEGNVGRLQNFGLSVSAQLQPAKWWSLSTQANLNHKIIEGQLWKYIKASITQLQLSINNQFRFKKGWGGEISGFYLTKNQNDLQEVLEPTGQLSIGASKQVMKNKGTIRLTVRDVFWTQQMAGWTDFQGVGEYFKLMRDTRVGTISFTYRFGKAIKQQARRSGGAAGEITERVGTVN
jgi:iron complex outermembrane recepter protein